jgi:calcineurin-like phosphoesterase family protein
MSIWLTADEHIEHGHVIRLMPRPYATIEEMEDDFVRRHNEVVKPGHRVYHLGDVSFKAEPARRYIDRLNGDHFLIEGNHDPKKHTANWVWIGKRKMVKIDGEQLFLSHYAHRTWPQSNYGSYHCYGHSHGMIDPYRRSMDVGVDTNNYYPVHYTEVIAARRKYIPVNHHP